MKILQINMGCLVQDICPWHWDVKIVTWSRNKFYNLAYRFCIKSFKIRAGPSHFRELDLDVLMCAQFNCCCCCFHRDSCCCCFCKGAGLKVPAKIDRRLFAFYFHSSFKSFLPLFSKHLSCRFVVIDCSLKLLYDCCVSSQTECIFLLSNHY